MYDDVVVVVVWFEGYVYCMLVMMLWMIDDVFGVQVFFKCENLQCMGVFKFCGVFNVLLCFSVEQCGYGVVVFLLGNYVQVIVLLVCIFGIFVMIVMLQDVLVVKMVVMCGYGGNVVIYDCYIEDCEQIGCEFVEKYGFMLVLFYDYLDVIVGQGIVVKELFDEVGLFDVVFMLFGGGGLLLGIVFVMWVLLLYVKLYGVEFEVGNDVQ